MWSQLLIRLRHRGPFLMRLWGATCSEHPASLKSMSAPSGSALSGVLAGDSPGDPSPARPCQPPLLGAAEARLRADPSSLSASCHPPLPLSPRRSPSAAPASFSRRSRPPPPPSLASPLPSSRLQRPCRVHVVHTQPPPPLPDCPCGHPLRLSCFPSLPRPPSALAAAQTRC